MYDETDHGDADEHPDGGQASLAGAEDRTKRRPPGGETALGDDHDQGAEAENPGQRGVRELDAQPGLADRDAQQEVDQQTRQARPGRQPHRHHGDQQHTGAEQQRGVDGC